jgi:hypothetical protein
MEVGGEVMMWIFILFCLMFLVGSFGILLGSIGIRNRRFLGYLLVTAGLAMAFYSGFNIYDQVVYLRTDEKMIEVIQAIGDLESRVTDVENLRQDFTNQRDMEFKKLDEMGIAFNGLEQELEKNRMAYAVVQRISLLNRWIDVCESQMDADGEALANYRNMLFYMENLEKVDAVDVDLIPAVASKVDLELLEEEAKTSKGNDEVEDITHVEIERVIDMYRTLND